MDCFDPSHGYAVGMNTQPVTSLANLPPVPLLPRVFVVVTSGRQIEGLTELITRLALHGPFHLIAGGEWLPDQDSLRRSVRRHTVAVERALDHPILGRPATCLQLRDQLLCADSPNDLLLILDFLHHFHNPDIDLSLRQRVLEDCCCKIRLLSQTIPVIILVQKLDVEEYQQFFPALASIADEILEAEEANAPDAVQGLLF
jgi:hypothetical protein